MPGAKRRALKKLLSPITSPTPSTTSSPPNLPSPSDPSSKSFSSLHHANSLSSVNSGIAPSLSGSTAVTADPANYLTDQELKKDLLVEEMIDRGEINGNGNGSGGVENGVPSLSYSVPPPSGPSVPPSVVGNGGGKKKSSKQRFAEREARKREALLNSAPPSDPAWNAQLEKERLEEIRVISDACIKLGREIFEIQPDGHCMYSAIADQLSLLSLNPSKDSQDPRYTRQAAAEYMLSHPDEFMPFLPSIGGEDSAGATDDGVMSLRDFEIYCQRVRETGEWGGEPEIQALSKAFRVPIHVIQSGPPTVVSHGGADDSFGGAMTPEQSASMGDHVVRITYHRRMYGLGEHYNSLRKVQEGKRGGIPASILFM